MKKMAFFVEGMTEQLFVEKVFEEVIGRKNLFISKQTASTDRSGNRIFATIDAQNKYSGQEYYILIRDCCGETNVQSDIIDNCESLWNSGYERIVGLRDVYPLTAADIPNLQRGMRHGVPTKFMPISIILAVMEVEAWFLGETNHFSQIDSSLTQQTIKAAVGFDPWVDDVESRHHPAEDLDNIYKVVGARYTKKRNRVARTVNALDYANLYLGLTAINSLQKMIGEIDSFLT